MGLSADLGSGRTAVDTAIFIYLIEEHPDEPERYWRYVHIMTHDADLVLELSAATKAALALIPLAAYEKE